MGRNREQQQTRQIKKTGSKKGKLHNLTRERAHRANGADEPDTIENELSSLKPSEIARRLRKRGLIVNVLGKGRLAVTGVHIDREGPAKSFLFLLEGDGEL